MCLEQGWNMQCTNTFTNKEDSVRIECPCVLYILQVVSRRDSGRGDTVVVNGVRHSLDLVALIAYFKLKKKCQGLYTHTVDHILT